MSKTDMMLYLTTRGRPDEQLTLEHLPRKWIERTIVVCPSSEAKQFSKDWPGLYDIKVSNLQNLAVKRAWVFNHSHQLDYERIMMLDDDLRFHVRVRNCEQLAGFGRQDVDVWRSYVRKWPEAAKLELSHNDDSRLDRMFVKIERMLGTYAHGGMNSRFMSHTFGGEWKLNKRYLHALAYHVPTVMEHCELNRILLSSDYDYALQLMRAGYESAVYCWGTEEDPRGFNAPGGVSLYRNARKIRACSEQLAALHPGLVRLVPYGDDSKHADLGVRTVANWKRAIAEGLALRGTRTGRIEEK